MLKYRNFDIKNYSFQKILSDMFGVDDLRSIHEFLTQKYDIFNVDNDQDTEIHQKFYNQMNNHFIDEYEKFIKQEILPNFDEDIYAQRTPTFRLSFPGNIAVGGFHKDSDYNHSTKEINFFLPFTKSHATNAIWYQDEDGEYKPMTCDVGQFVEWDGANIMHGNKVNETTHTRVSIDFRIIKVQDYNSQSNNKVSITNKVKFDSNNYWKLFIK